MTNQIIPMDEVAVKVSLEYGDLSAQDWIDKIQNAGHNDLAVVAVVVILILIGVCLKYSGPKSGGKE